MNTMFPDLVTLEGGSLPGSAFRALFWKVLRYFFTLINSSFTLDIYAYRVCREYTSNIGLYRHMAEYITHQAPSGRSKITNVVYPPWEYHNSASVQRI